MAEQENRSPVSETPAKTDIETASAARRTRRRVAICVMVVLVALLLWWRPWSRTSGNAASPNAPATHAGRGSRATLPQPVHVATAKAGDMPIVLTALGTVTPLATVTVQTQLSGTLQSVAFKEG